MARKSAFVKASFLFAVIIVPSLALWAQTTVAEKVSETDSSFSTSLSEARAFASSLWYSGALNKPLETARSMFPLGWPNTFLGAIAGLTIVGAFKVGLFMITSVWLITTAFPSILAFLGLTSPFLFRSLQDTFPTFGEINYEFVARSVNSLPDKSMDLMNIKGGECRARAICEAGEFVAKKIPWMARFASGIMSTIKMSDLYTIAMVRGMSNSDCASYYGSCSHSPFKKLTTMSVF